MTTHSPAFRFDKKLWESFIRIAQPYFYPLERNGGWKFASLLIALLFIVVSVTFFALLAVTKLGQLIVPEKIVTIVAKDLIGQIDQWIISPLPGIAALFLIAGIGIFLVFWPKIRQRFWPWLLLGGIVFLIFTINGINVGITFIARALDNSLFQREENQFWRFLGIYVLSLMIALPVRGALSYLPQQLGLLWRSWLTNELIQRYFSQRTYYQLDSNSANTQIDNPDQRIQEDARYFTETTLTFMSEIFDSILTLLSFTLILWSISQQLTLGLLGYALIGTAISVLSGSKLIGINFDQLRLEANFRYGLVHVRDNAETIAFYRGEELEKQEVNNRFVKAFRNFERLIIWSTVLSVFQRLYDYFSRIPPYLIVVPLFFAKEKDFGAISQSIIAYSQVLSALSLITYRIQDISKFAAGVNRLGAFEQTMRQIEAQADHPPQRQIQIELSDRIHFIDLTIETPGQQRVLLTQLNYELPMAGTLLIVGPSGCGKTSLLRTIAGLWTTGSGQIQRPATEDMLFLPQRPYMLLSNLRDQLTYPNMSGKFSDGELQDALRLVNLEHLSDRYATLDAIEDWTTTLSLGEQQRLAFARLLLSEPRLAILDEATSALDVRNEHHLYGLLQNLKIGYLSVGHRPTLTQYHTQVLEILPDSNWRIIDASEYQVSFT